MPFSAAPTNYQLLISSIDSLIDLGNEAIKTMNPSVISRLRGSAQQFIIQRYGKEHHFNISFRRIDRIDSQYYLNQIKGVLHSIKDDIQFVYSMNNITAGSTNINNDDSILTGKILSLFYNHIVYNWDAVSNLVRWDADYYEFSVEDAQRVYNKLLEKRMIARIGIDIACCITDEGRRLYEAKYKPVALVANDQEYSGGHSLADNDSMQLTDKAGGKADRKAKTRGRDNFTRKTSDTLAKRVGYACSNPKCKKTTTGAHNKADKATVIGIAAHISAAAVGGPRFDASLSSESRKQPENGIWLCSNCATLVDKDPDKFTVDILKKWKADAEEDSRQKIDGQFYNNNPRK